MMRFLLRSTLWAGIDCVTIMGSTGNSSELTDSNRMYANSLLIICNTITNYVLIASNNSDITLTPIHIGKEGFQLSNMNWGTLQCFYVCTE